MNLTWKVAGRMKKIALICLIMLFAHLQGLSQFVFHVFPTGVSGDPFADLLLNTRIILTKAGIRQVRAYQTLPELTKSFATKTMYFNEHGYIEKVTICFAKNKN